MAEHKLELKHSRDWQQKLYLRIPIEENPVLNKIKLIHIK
jgi:hypothetical protein